MLGVGLSIPQVAGRGGLDSAAAALVARMSVAPDAARAGLIDATVRALKAAGVWARLELLYLLAAHDAQAARVNWVQPGFALSVAGAPAFTADRGYAGDGSAAHLDTGFNPANAGLTTAAGAIGAWCRDTGASAGVAIGCANGAPGLYLATNASGVAVARIHQSTATTAAVANAQGLTAAERSGDSVQLYRGGVGIGGATVAASAVPNATVFLLALGNAGSAAAHDARQYAAGFVAREPLGPAGQAALHAALAGYLAGVGAV